MLNAIWLGMIFLAVLTGAIEGRLDAVVHSIIESAKLGFEVALGLAGVMAFWLGLMEVAMASGLVTIFARILKPVMKRLFPDVPPDHPAMGAMLLNMAANMLGIANAATPFGLKAMKELAKLNERADVASDAMCTFLAINTSSLQLIPATAIALLAASGSANPSSVIVTGFFATLCSTIVGVVAVKQLAKSRFYKFREMKVNE